MRKIKLFLSLLMVMLVSVGNVWATDETVTYTLTGATTVSVTGTAPDGATVSASTNGSWISADSRLQLAGKTAEKNYTLTLSGFDGCTITGLKVKLGSNAKAGNAALTFVAGSETLASIASANLNDASWFGGWVSSGSEKTVTLSNDEYEIQEDEDVVLTITNTANSAYVYYVSVTYTPAATGDVIVKTLKSIAVEGMTTSYETGDAFSFDGTCTATYSVTKNEEPQADEEKTVTPTSVTSPDMSSAGVKTITVSFTDEETKTTTYDINVTAAQPKSTLIFEDEYKDSGATADDGAEWDVTSDAPESTYEAARGIHFGTGSSSQVQYLQLSTSDISGTITKVVVNASDATGTGTISVSVDGTDFTCGGSTTVANSNPGNDYTFTGSASGEIVVLIDRGSAAYKAIYVKSIVVSYIPAAVEVKKPTFSVAGGSYLDAQNVEITCETADASIFYTLDESDPSSASTPYTSAITISETKTLKAIAIKDEVSSPIATATYTITTPLSVTAAIALIPNANDQVDNQYVEGFVCTEASSVLSGGKMTYYISADGSETDRLQIYKGKNLDNTEFSNVNDLAIGDKVIIFGQLKNYSGTKEMNDGNYIVRRTAKGALSSVVVSGTPDKTAYSADEAFEPAGLVVTATYASGYAVNVTSELAAADWSATPATVTENGNISVTATYGGMTSAAYLVPVTVVAATLDHIALSYDAVEVYQGKPLPKPVVTAHWSDATTSDVTALASFTGYDKDTPGDQTITVSYQFGTGDPEEATYTVTVKPIYNVELAASVAKDLIETVVGNTESTSDMIVRGIVSQVGSISSKCLTYYISDDGTTTNQLEIFKGKYLSNADFTDGNKLKVGDEVVVTGKVIYYNNNTAEFANGKSQVTSLARTPNFAITDVTALEVGATDLAVADLTINVEGEGAVTFASSDNTNAVTIVDGKLHAVAAGTATITANLAANGIYKAATAEFNVTVVPATVKYAITFSGNGATGGDAPEFASEAAAGANITLPANTYTYTGHSFTGWKVYDENEDEVTVTANAFEMPASPVTIKAQWAEISVWAYVYTSNVDIESNTAAHVTIGGTDYDAAKTSKGASATITLPQGVTTIHLHLVAWSGEAQTVTVSGDCFNEDKELTITDNSNVSGSGTTYDLGESGVDYYFSLTPDKAVAANEVITIDTEGNKRFVLFGVNQEGGIVPELQSLAVSGDLENKEYEAGAAINPAGLTVMGTYTLGGTPQTPVDVTDQVEEWLYDALQAGDETVTISAKIGTVTSAGYEISGLTVTDPTPRFETNPTSYISFGSKEQGATITARDLEVTLVNVSNASVEITGTGAAAFSVDEDALTGNATLHVSASSANVGTFAATLTISDEAGVAADKEISLSLTVTEPETPETAVSTTSKWVVATAADLVDGAEVLITGVKDDVTYAMGGQNKNNRAAVAASVDGEDVLTPGENTMSFTLVAQETEGVFALRTSNGKYLYAAASGDNYMKTQNEVDVNAKWTISATSAVAESSSNRNVMQFNGGSTLFSCYNTASQSAIKLYVPKPVKYTVTFDKNDGSATTSVEVIKNEKVAKPADPTREGYTFNYWTLNAVEYDFDTPVTDNITLVANWTENPAPSYTEVRNGLNAGEYYTMCLDKAVTAVQGGTIWRVLSKAQNTSDIILEEVEGMLDAGRPYIFFATAATLEVAYTGDAVGAPITTGNNGLIGSFSQAHIDNVNTNYIIYNNELYYVNTDNVYVGAHRAYIDMTAVPDYSEPQQGNAPRRRVTMHTNAPQVATGIDALNASDKPVKMVINGQLFILRGEKMYNVNGQLVK